VNSTCLCVIKNELIEGSSEKANRTIFWQKNDVIIKIVHCFELSAAFKNTFLFIDTNVFVEN
jgi:hypothetical protein